MRKLFAWPVALSAMALAGCQSSLFSNGPGVTGATAQGGSSWSPQSIAKSFSQKQRSREGLDPEQQRRLDQLLVKGKSSLDQGDLPGARISLDTALTIDAANGMAHHLLGRIGDQEQRFEDAEYHYLQALSAKGNDADLLSDLGYSYMLQDRMGEAERNLKKAVAADPSHRMANVNLAAVHAYEGDTQLALAQLRQIFPQDQAQQALGSIIRQPRPAAVARQQTQLAAARQAAPRHATQQALPSGPTAGQGASGNGDDPLAELRRLREAARGEAEDAYRAKAQREHDAQRQRIEALARMEDVERQQHQFGQQTAGWQQGGAMPPHPEYGPTPNYNHLANHTMQPGPGSPMNGMHTDPRAYGQQQGYPQQSNVPQGYVQQPGFAPQGYATPQGYAPQHATQPVPNQYTHGVSADGSGWDNGSQSGAPPQMARMPMQFPGPDDGVPPWDGQPQPRGTERPAPNHQSQGVEHAWGGQPASGMAPHERDMNTQPSGVTPIPVFRSTPGPQNGVYAPQPARNGSWIPPSGLSGMSNSTDNVGQVAYQAVGPKGHTIPNAPHSGPPSGSFWQDRAARTGANGASSSAGQGPLAGQDLAEARRAAQLGMSAGPGALVQLNGGGSPYSGATQGPQSFGQTSQQSPSSGSQPNEQFAAGPYLAGAPGTQPAGQPAANVWGIHGQTGIVTDHPTGQYSEGMYQGQHSPDAAPNWGAYNQTRVMPWRQDHLAVSNPFEAAASNGRYGDQYGGQFQADSSGMPPDPWQNYPQSQSATWDFRSNQPISTAAPLQQPEAFSQEWQSGTMMSPTMSPAFGQPNWRNPEAENGAVTGSAARPGGSGVQGTPARQWQMDPSQSVPQARR